VEGEHLFSGNALGKVGADGAVRLPPFVLAVLARRGAAGRVLLGAHASAPCLTAFDAGRLAAVSRDLERLRRRDEEAGEESGLRHAARARRAFGLSETAEVAEDGRVALPAFLRARGAIGARALFVGTGAEVEIWDAELARAADDPALRALAEYRLAEDGAGKGEEPE
jgi:DNA-binding transcriptional regulator/RsmH inhibitor MraZ